MRRRRDNAIARPIARACWVWRASRSTSLAGWAEEVAGGENKQRRPFGQLGGQEDKGEGARRRRDERGRDSSSFRPEVVGRACGQPLRASPAGRPQEGGEPEELPAELIALAQPGGSQDCRLVSSRPILSLRARASNLFSRPPCQPASRSAALNIHQSKLTYPKRAGAASEKRTLFPQSGKLLWPEGAKGAGANASELSIVRRLRLGQMNWPGQSGAPKVASGRRRRRSRADRQEVPIAFSLGARRASGQPRGAAARRAAAAAGAAFLSASFNQQVREVASP